MSILSLPVGDTPADTARERRVKSVFALSMIGGTLFSAQLAVLGDRTSFELIFDGTVAAGTLGALVVLHASKRVDLAYMFVAGIALIALTAGLLVIGNRDGDLAFFLVFPIFAVPLLGARRSLPWFAATMALAGLAVVAEPVLPDWSSPLQQSSLNPDGLLFADPTKARVTYRQLTAFATAMTLVYVLIYVAYRALSQANERIESLLLNVLPPSIAARLSDETREKLREEGAGIADEFSEATILFADIVGFTDLAARTPTAELMRILDEVFTEFDHLAEKHKVEKIKTIGDAYMAVCGLPEGNPAHARNIAEMALEMMEAVRHYRETSGIPIRLRIGINSGPVIAGIIGRKKFIYDLWGDAVNVASRMESQGQPGTVQVSSGTYQALKNAYEFQPLGQVEIKGKGQMPAWRLIGSRAMLTGDDS